MYMLSTDKVHATLEIRVFKGNLSPNNDKKIKEGKVIQFNRYHVAERRKALEELAHKIREQWINEAQELIKKYESLKVQLK